MTLPTGPRTPHEVEAPLVAAACIKRKVERNQSEFSGTHDRIQATSRLLWRVLSRVNVHLESVLALFACPRKLSSTNIGVNPLAEREIATITAYNALVYRCCDCFLLVIREILGIFSEATHHGLLGRHHEGHESPHKRQVTRSTSYSRRIKAGVPSDRERARSPRVLKHCSTRNGNRGNEHSTHESFTRGPRWTRQHGRWERGLADRGVTRSARCQRRPWTTPMRCRR